MSRAKPTNPFYVVLVVVGTAFVVTATAYGVMAFRATSPVASPGLAFDAWLGRYGSGLLIGELVLLAIVTLAAMGTDDYWDRRAARRKVSPSEIEVETETIG